MLKSTEISNSIEELKNEIKALQNENKIEEAYAKLADLDNLKKELEIANKLEAEDLENSKIVDKKGEIKEMNNEVSLLRTMIKNVKGVRLNDKEIEAYQNAVTNPEAVEMKELSTKIHDLIRHQDTLKDVVVVRKTVAKSGQFPVFDPVANALVEIVPGQQMTDTAKLKFNTVNFALKGFGMLAALTDEILMFSDADLLQYVAQIFVRAYVDKVNQMIADKMLNNGEGAREKKQAANVKAVAKLVRTGLDRGHKAKVLVATVSAVEAMIADENADQISYVQPNISAEPIMMINNVPVKVVDDKILGEDGNKTAVLLDKEQAIMLFENNEYVISVSKEAGFLSNVVYSKIVTYLDCATIDDKAILVMTIGA